MTCQPQRDWTPLMFVVEEADYDMVDLLLREKAHINAANKVT